MVKVFISQPMNGLSNEEIENERGRIENYLKSTLLTDVFIIDSFFKDAPHDAKPLWYLGKSLELLSTADIVYFAKGWTDARGCKIEYECAMAYGYTIFDEIADFDVMVLNKR